MLSFGTSVPSGTRIDCDVCIVGSGPAGLSVALGLRDSGLKVCMLESGSTESAPVPDALYQLRSTKLPVSPESRVRSFGGTTSVWSGRWKAHDEIDFRRRDWVPLSGWPINRRALEPYYEKTSALFGIQHSDDVPVQNLFPHSPSLEPTAFSTQRQDRWQWGKTFQEDIAASPSLTIYLDCHVTSLSAAGEVLREATVQTPSGSIRVGATAFVLAAGGIENPRLLLANGLGNAYDQVGRYYMDHPKGKIGVIEAYGNIDLTSLWNVSTDHGRVDIGFRLTDDCQQREKLLNSHVLLEPLSPKDVPARLLKRLLPTKRSGLIAIRDYLEQLPSPENRVRLSDQLDPYGVPLPAIDWSIDETAERTMRTFHAVLSEACQLHELGEVDSPLLSANPVPPWKDASHHMGTTRMGTDPKTSVTNSDAKVHGLQNLFIAGSSLFPTGGYANPTATICALGLRLADHLRSRLV